MNIIIQVVFLACLAATGYTTFIPDNNTSTNSVDLNTKKGIVFFSFDNAGTWENRSNGLPRGINLTDMVAGDSAILITTKQQGLFSFDFQSRTWKKMAGSPATEKDIDVINIFRNRIIAGTGGDGIFMSTDNGKSWIKKNSGLGNLTIRRIVNIDNTMLVGTNGGIYSWNAFSESWNWVFGDNGLQVNGITKFGEEIYAGTNKGIFKLSKDGRNWKHILKNFSLHNINADDRLIYAMAYNEMFASNDRGNTWSSLQAGIPKGWYTFQVKQKGDAVFAAQWDGVYMKKGQNQWKLASKGLPPKFAATELVVYKDMIIAASSGWIEIR